MKFGSVTNFDMGNQNIHQPFHVSLVIHGNFIVRVGSGGNVKVVAAMLRFVDFLLLWPQKGLFWPVMTIKRYLRA